jgi:hypothetical protein
VTDLTVIPQGSFDPKEMFPDEASAAAFARNCSAGGLWWTGYIDGALACVFGANPQSLIGDTALFWLAVTPVVAKRQLAFARGAREVTAALLQRWPRLIGHCDGARAERFLRYLGASLGAPDQGMTTFRIERRGA